MEKVALLLWCYDSDVAESNHVYNQHYRVWHLRTFDFDRTGVRQVTDWYPEVPPKDLLGSWSFRALYPMSLAYPEG